MRFNRKWNFMKLTDTQHNWFVRLFSLIVAGSLGFVTVFAQTIDYGGGDLLINSNTPLCGNHININNFTVSAGVTLTVSCDFLHVEAQNINILGTINANGAGGSGGTGGAGGLAAVGGSSCISGQAGVAGSNGLGVGGGSGGNTGGLPALCFSRNCSGSDGYIAGGGGGGSGTGGAHHGVGGHGGSGGFAAIVYVISGGAGGTTNPVPAAYGDDISYSINAGSGGGGAAGGGGGYTDGTAGGNGGNGGGRVELIASNTFNMPASGAIYANGTHGAPGGSGGGASSDNKYDCFADGTVEKVDVCANSPFYGNYIGSGGGGGGAGGGSGGGILIASTNTATISGIIQSMGGNGGDAGFPNQSLGSCFSNPKGGGGGSGGKIKIFVNPCLNNVINPVANVDGGIEGASFGGVAVRAPSGTLLTLNHPSYVPFDPGIIEANQDICFGDNPNGLVFSTPPSGGLGTYTYQWMLCSAFCLIPPLGFNDIPSANTNSYTPPAPASEGTYYYLVMVQSGSANCRDWAGPVTINVYDPAINIISSSGTDACVGGNITLDSNILGGSGTCSYQWQYSDDGGSSWINVGGNSSIYNVPTSTVINNRLYRCWYTCTGTACDDAVSNVLTINVVEAPQWDVVSVAPNPLCEGGSVNLSATVINGAGGLLQWQRRPLSGSEWISVSSPDYPGLGNWQYQPLYSVSGTGCTIDDGPVIDVLVVDDPVVTITSSQTQVCQNIPIPLTATALGGAGTCVYQWQYFDGTSWISVGDNSDEYIIPGTEPFVNRLYRVVYTCDGSGCDQAFSNEIQITVYEKPIVVGDASPNPQCRNQPVVITATVTGGTEPYTYNWSAGLGGGATHTVTPTVNTTYIVTVTDANGCTARVTIPVTINQLPLVSVTANPNPQCANEPVNLNAVGSNTLGPYTYVWNNGLGEGQSHVVNPIENTNYRVTVTDARGCTRAGSVTVVVNPEPVLTATASPNPQCSAEPVDLSATASGGSEPYTYSWDNGLGNGQNHTVNPVVNTTYAVTVTDNNGCTAGTTVDVIINELPVVSAEASPNPQCAADPVNLTATASGGIGPYSYEWDNGLGVGQNHTVNPAINTTYTVTIHDNNGCSATATVAVIVNQLPVLTVIATPNPQCSGEPVTLTASTLGGTAPYAYLWDNGLGAGDTHTVSPLVNTTYQVTVSDANGCTNTGSVDVLINALPIATATETNQATCGASNGVATVVGLGGLPPYSFLWSNGDNSADGVAENLAPGPYTVTVTDNNACSTSAVVVISSPVDIDAIAIETNPVSCFGGTNGIGQLTVSGGNEPYNISWSNGVTTGNITGINAGVIVLDNLSFGNYIIEITDSDNCVETVFLSISQSNEITVNIVSNQLVSCYGESDASVIFTVSDGTPNYSIVWSNGTLNGSLINVSGGPHTLNALNAGNYTITITDANMCEIVDGFEIVDPSPISVDLALTSEPLCFGEGNGEISFEISGGTALYGFVWENGTANGSENNVNTGLHSITGIAAGVFGITITDNNSCSISASIPVTQPPSLIVDALQISPVSCFGESDATAQITVMGGTEPYTILYSNGSFSISLPGLSVGNHIIANLTAGTYSVSVIDAHACQTTSSFVIQEPDEILVSALIGSLPSCNGYNDGTANVLVSGGTPPYDIAWDNGASSGSIAGSFFEINPISSLSSGNYTITVIDANSCTVTGSFVLTEPELLSSVVTVISDVLCYGESSAEVSVSISGGTSLYNLQWSNGSVSGSLNGVGAGPHLIENLPAGTYTLDISDANACFYSTTFVIVQAPIIGIATGNTQNVSCTGGNNGSFDVSIINGIAPFNIHWNNGTTSGSIIGVGAGPHTVDNLSAGNYMLEVTDSNGCEAVAFVIINEPASLLAASVVSVSDASCIGVSDGSAVITVSGGVAPYTYNWDHPNGFGNEISNVTAGSYHVTVTDSWNCAVILVVVINQPEDGLNATAVSNVVSCPGGSDGSISIAVTGGTAPYTYTWFPDVASGHLANNLSPGTYNITVNDAGSCVQLLSVDVSVDPNTLSASVESITPALCSGSSDGSALAIALLGYSPYTYSWDDQASTGDAQLSNVAQGTYTVTITDAHNCSATAIAEITAPDIIDVLLANVEHIACFGESTGAIVVSASGGTAPYTYLWEDNAGNNMGVNAPNIGNLLSGTYYVSVTDANNCPYANLSVAVLQPAAPLAVSISEIAQPSCFGENNGELVASVSGGSLPILQYAWGNPIDAYTGSNPGGLSAATYSITVTDNNSCTAEASFVLNQPNQITIDVNTSNVLCFGDNSGSAQAIVNGGLAPYDYVWFNALGNTISVSEFADNLSSGTYTIEVTDANLCVSVTTAIIGEPGELILTANHTDASTYGNIDGSAEVIVIGGTQPYTYVWENAANPGVVLGTGESISGLSAGTYCVTVIDFNSCISSVCVVVSQPPDQLTGVLQSHTDISCLGYTDGSVTITGIGGTPPYSYEWQNSMGLIISLNPVITGLTAGNYYLTITDAMMFTWDTLVVITQPEVISINLVFGSALACYSDANGQVSVGVSGGTEPYSYHWENELGIAVGDNNPTVDNLPAGIYFVTVSDVNNCPEVFSAVAITQPELLVANITEVTQPSCFGFGDGSITVSTTGGVMPLGDYQWGSPIEDFTGSTPTSLTSGLYSVTVTDSNMCTATAEYLLQQPTALSIIVVPTSTTGYGAATGSAEAFVTGGTSGYTYAWENNANPGIIVSVLNPATGLLAGSYCVTITDANGCTISDCFSVTEPEELSVSISAVHNICFNDSNGMATAIVTGGITPYSYLWQDANGNIIANSVSVSGLASGTYYVTVTDFNGFNASAEVLITQPQQLIVENVVLIQPLCNASANGSVIISVVGGNAPYVYSWVSDGITVSNEQNLWQVTAGTYYLFIVDSNNCTFDTVFTLVQPDAIVVEELDVYSIDCPYNNGTGSVTTNVSGGTGNYTYNWYYENELINITTSYLNNALAGNYSLEVLDQNNCQADIQQFFIDMPEDFAINYFIDSISCYGASDGAITIEVSGGTSPYSHQWNPAVSSSNTAQHLITGDYYVTITDANACTTTVSAIVGQPDAALSVSFIPTADVSCYGMNDASGNIEFSGGTMPYTISWFNNGQQYSQNNLTVNSFEIENLFAGPFNVTVTDVRNCQAEGNYEIIQPSAIVAAITNVQHLSCFEDMTGAFMVEANGGTGNLQYIFDNSGTSVSTPGVEGLTAGWHYIEVYDENSCSYLDSVLITQPPQLVVSIPDTIFLNCFGDSNGAAAVSIEGGSPGYQTSWINADGVVVGNGMVIQALNAGLYYVQVIDQNSCFANDSMVILQPDLLQLSIGGENPLCHNGSDGQLWVTAVGGTSPYSYSWDITAENNDTIIGLPAGYYSVRVIDINNCQTEISYQLINPAAITYELQLTHVDCSEHMGSAAITVYGGTPPYTYNWSNGGANHLAMNLAGGSYQVTVADDNACSITTEVSIDITGEISANINQETQIRCFGENTAVLMAISNGHAPLAYQWLPIGAATQSINNIGAGNYSVIITDAWGCEGNGQFTVQEPPQINADFITTHVRCKYESNGNTRVVTSGGSPGYSYFWYHNGSTAQSVQNLVAGTYVVQITDINDCVLDASVQIMEPDSVLSAHVITQNATCYQSNDARAAALGLGGTPPYTYQWVGAGGYTLNQAYTDNNLFPGTYTLNVRDINNCLHSQMVMLFEPEPIYVNVDASSGPSCYGNTDGYIVLNDIVGGTPPYRIYVSGGNISWDQQIPEIDSIPAGIYRIDVIDDNNCHHEGPALTVVLNDSDIDCLQIPGAFSPNGDGHNDTWEISNVWMFQRILIQVYNRWGQLMYEAGYNDPFWDGTYNGSPAPVGSYLYHIDINNNIPPVTGTVTIIR